MCANIVKAPNWWKAVQDRQRRLRKNRGPIRLAAIKRDAVQSLPTVFLPGLSRGVSPNDDAS